MWYHITKKRGVKIGSKVVLVTGSSRGIGRATVIEFARKGYDVVINYVNSETSKGIKRIYREEF